MPRKSTPLGFLGAGAGGVGVKVVTGVKKARAQKFGSCWGDGAGEGAGPGVSDRSAQNLDGSGRSIYRNGRKVVLGA